MKTELQSRTLWFDGTSEVDSSAVKPLLLMGVCPSKIIVKNHDQETIAFNRLSDIEIKDSKNEHMVFDLNWEIPEYYLNLDIDQYINQKLSSFLSSKPQLDRSAYENRLRKEMLEIKKAGMSNLIKTLIYVVDTFRSTNTIWGVGRGSSCASLALFLIDVHRVDPVKYGISMEEFFHS